MNVLVIGGPKHGEWIEVFDGTRVWIDIANAAQHVVRTVTSNVQDIQTGAVLEAYTLHVAVHEQLQGPTEPAVVSQLISLLAMNEYSRAHGEAQEIPKEPAGSSLTVPGGPA